MTTAVAYCPVDRPEDEAAQQKVAEHRQDGDVYGDQEQEGDGKAVGGQPERKPQKNHHGHGEERDRKQNRQPRQELRSERSTSRKEPHWCSRLFDQGIAGV